MSKVYLSSKGIFNRAELFRLLGKERDVKTAWIANAFERRSPEDVASRRELVLNNLQSLGLNVSEVDLKKYTDPARLSQYLSGYDFIWVSGGDLEYLRTLMGNSCFDAVIKDLVNSGVVYGGDSAGAIVAGPTLEGFERPNQDGEAKKISYDGLGIVPFVPLPHWGREKFQTALDSIKEACEQRGLDALSMTDDQAVVFDGVRPRLIENVAVSP